MKKIKIFLASSIDDLRDDRIAMGDYFNQLNEVYIDRGVHFSLIKCEDYDNSVAADGKQSQYDQEIRESELCIFLFFNKVGEYTLHEFNVAREAFEQNGKPRIATYFKDAGENTASAVREFMSYLDTELRHYYNPYSHIDTLKLGVLMLIKLIGLDSTVKIEDGQVTVDGKPLITCDNVPVLKGNEHLQRLTNEKKRLLESVCNARREYIAEPNEDNLMRYEAELDALKSVSGELTTLEGAVLDFISTVSEITSNGKVLTHRQKTALKLYNAGDYLGAMAILEDASRDDELKNAQNLVKTGKNQVRGYIDEEMLWIRSRLAQGVDKAGFEDVICRMQAVAELCIEIGDAPTVYVPFMDILHKYGYYEKMLEFADAAVKHIDPLDKSICEVLVKKAVAYFEMKDYSRAINVYEDALERTNALEYKMLKVMCLDGLSVCHQYLKELEDSRRYMLLSIECALKLDDPMRLATVYNNAAGVYLDLGEPDKAEKYHLMAYDIFLNLGKKEMLAINAVNLNSALTKLNRINESAVWGAKAVDILKALYDAQPMRHASLYCAALNNYGESLRKLSRHGEAYEVLKLAVELQEKDPSDMIYYLAALLNLGRACVDVQRYDEGIGYIERGVQLSQVLYKRSPISFAGSIGGAYTALGIAYWRKGDLKAGEQAIYDSLRYFDELKKSSYVDYIRGALKAFEVLGDMYQKSKLYKLSEKAYLKAIREARGYEALLWLEISCVYAGLGRLYALMGKLGKCKKAFDKAVSGCVKVAENEKDAYGRYTVLVCVQAAEALADFKKHLLALEKLNWASTFLDVCDATSKASVYSVYVETYLELENYPAAEEYIKAALKLDGVNAELIRRIYYLYSVLCNNTDRFDEGEKYFQLFQAE